MPAAGRVCTGFSKPYIADYAVNAGVVTYSNPAKLARGVKVELDPSVADDNKFRADNVDAEDAGGMFTGGTVKLTVDGLFTAMKRRILGYPEPDADGWTPVGESATPPYVATGYIARFMSAGVTTYVPTVLTKTKFQTPPENAETQGEEISWQTQELTAGLFRDDTAEKNWKYEGAEFASEDLAEEALKTKLGYVAPTP